jgi:hypothetical protein
MEDYHGNQEIEMLLNLFVEGSKSQYLKLQWVIRSIRTHGA